MLVYVLAGPTVEQQGEMARSGGRMLATLEPEQVRNLAKGFVSFQSKPCYMVQYGSQACWPPFIHGAHRVTYLIQICSALFLFLNFIFPFVFCRLRSKVGFTTMVFWSRAPWKWWDQEGFLILPHCGHENIGELVLPIPSSCLTYEIEAWESVL
jgi:hypothetical protein